MFMYVSRRLHTFVLNKTCETLTCIRTRSSTTGAMSLRVGSGGLFVKRGELLLANAEYKLWPAWPPIDELARSIPRPEPSQTVAPPDPWTVGQWVKHRFVYIVRPTRVLKGSLPGTELNGSRVYCVY